MPSTLRTIRNVNKLCGRTQLQMLKEAARVTKILLGRFNCNLAHSHVICHICEVIIVERVKLVGTCIMHRTHHSVHKESIINGDLTIRKGCWSVPNVLWAAVML